MHRFLLPLIFIFCLSCAEQAALAPELPAEKAIAQAQVKATKHSKHIHRQQRDICNRLKQIQKRIEKNRKSKRKQ